MRIHQWRDDFALRFPVVTLLGTLVFLLCGTLRASILDLANATYSEAQLTAAPDGALLLPFDLAADIQALGVSGNLGAAGTAADKFRATLPEAGKIEFKFELTSAPAQTISALAAGGNIAYFLTNNNLWQRDPAQAQPQLIASAAELAAAFAAPAASLAITGLAATPAGTLYLVRSGSADIVKVDPAAPAGARASLAVTNAQVAALTGGAPSLAALAIDPAGVMYAADAVSGGVLKFTPQAGSFTPSIFTPGSILREAMVRDINEDLLQNRMSVPTAVVARTTGPFVPNALVAGAGLYGPQAGESTIFYVSQLGSPFGGSGAVNRVTTNPAQPDAATFSTFFDPNTGPANLNPSALALDPGAVFGGKMFLGTFGPSLGDDLDGKVYRLDPDGAIHDFVTSYVDANGAPATRNGVPITGFYDVTDLAFSPGGAFGDYLYVVSENNDTNGAAAGGFKSDLWRIGPDGVAHLFAPQLTDAAITLAFDTTGRYGSDLFVATYAHNTAAGPVAGQIFRVKSDGTVEAFLDLAQFSTDYSISDLAFGPDDSSALANKMILPIVDSQNSVSYLVTFEPDATTFQSLVNNLSTGDVSSGDLAFDPQGNLYVLEGGDSKDIRRVVYQDIYNYTVEALRFRPETADSVTTYAPYAQLRSGDIPRVVRLSASGAAADIKTEVNPLSSALANSTSDHNFSFTFDSAGKIYLWNQDRTRLRSAVRSAGNLFEAYADVLTADAIASALALVDPQISALAFKANGDLIAIARNGTAPAGAAAPDHDLDDQVVKLGNAPANTWAPVKLAGVTDLTLVDINLTGEQTSRSFSAAGGTVLSQTVENLPAGDYTFELVNKVDAALAYNLLVSLGEGFENILTLNAESSPMQFTTLGGATVNLAWRGPGQAVLSYSQRPGGAFVSGANLEITGSNLASSFELAFVGDRDPNDLYFEKLTLNGSILNLHYAGSAARLTVDPNVYGLIYQARLGAVDRVETPRFTYRTLQAQRLGQSGSSGVVQARAISNLAIAGDLTNVNVLDSTSLNVWQNIDIGGVITGSKIYGRSAAYLVIRNTQAAANAMAESSILLNRPGGTLEKMEVLAGDVSGSTITINNRLGCLNLLAGNLKTTALTAGNHLRRLYVSGNIENPSAAGKTIDANFIDTIITGGNLQGRLSGDNINRVLVGFDQNGRRRAENTTYTGSDLTGSTITVTRLLKEVNATGKIANSTLTSNLYLIYNVYAEDGFEDSTAQAYIQVARVLIGYLGGQRGVIANEQADVSGSFTGTFGRTGALGRLYYTGTLDPATRIPIYHGPVVDDVRDQ